jgi:glycosyltransferase involved in cell wall biosynthesis
VSEEHHIGGVISGNPFFSVITPSWNQGEYLGECIESVLRQGDTDFEHLIFDNSSTDSSAKVISRHPHVRCISEPDRGQSDAVNKGFVAARGEIICWLNSDDAYPPGLFKRLRELFSDPKVEVVFGDVLQKNYDGSLDQVAPAHFERRADLVRWWSRDVKLHQPAIFFRRAVREKTGLLREDLHYVMDYEYWWRMSEHVRFHYTPEVLAVQHRQPASKTVMDWDKVYFERERIFSPHYGVIDGGDPHGLSRERRNSMAENYLRLAWASSCRSVAARKNMKRAFFEKPSVVATPSFLGLLVREVRKRG